MPLCVISYLYLPLLHECHPVWYLTFIYPYSTNASRCNILPLVTLTPRMPPCVLIYPYSTNATRCDILPLFTLSPRMSPCVISYLYLPLLHECHPVWYLTFIYTYSRNATLCDIVPLFILTPRVPPCVIYFFCLHLLHECHPVWYISLIYTYSNSRDELGAPRDSLQNCHFINYSSRDPLPSASDILLIYTPFQLHFKGRMLLTPMIYVFIYTYPTSGDGCGPPVIYFFLHNLLLSFPLTPALGTTAVSPGTYFFA